MDHPSSPVPEAAAPPPTTSSRGGTILGSLLRGRRHSNSHLHPPLSPSAEVANPLAAAAAAPTASGMYRSNSAHRRRPATGDTAHTPPTGGGAASPGVGAPPPLVHNASSSGGGAFSGILRRRRSGGALNGAAAATSTTPPPLPPSASRQGTQAPGTGGVSGLAPAPAGHERTASSALPANPSAPTHRLRLVPHLENRRSLKFDAITRDVREGDSALRIGRFTDRSGAGATAANALTSNKLAFKSKVVSRTHAEIWVDAAGKFFIKDTKSSSGTFLNHVRLSPANAESRPHELRDGDILQLGVDYQGGTEDIYKCVKIRVEAGREWQASANAFNTNALKQLKSLAVDLTRSKDAQATGQKTSTKTGLPDCCICLFSVSIQQALFIAPCSHAFHFKCLRPLLEQHYPAFICPLCRTFADLDADVEVDAAEDDAGGWEEADALMVDTPAIPSAAAAARRREDAADAGGGFETEVEADTGASRLGSNIRRAPPPAVPAAAPLSASPSALGARRPDLTHLAEEDEEDEDEDEARSLRGGMSGDDEEMLDARLGGGAPARARGGGPMLLSEDEGEYGLAPDAMDGVAPGPSAGRTVGGGAGSAGSSESVSDEGMRSPVTADVAAAGKRKR